MDTLRQLYQFSSRNLTVLRPPQPRKQDNAIRIGLLGASQIAYDTALSPITLPWCLEADLHCPYISNSLQH